MVNIIYQKIAQIDDEQFELVRLNSTYSMKIDLAINMVEVCFVNDIVFQLMAEYFDDHKDFLMTVNYIC